MSTGLIFLVTLKEKIGLALRECLEAKNGQVMTFQMNHLMIFLMEMTEMTSSKV